MLLQILQSTDKWWGIDKILHLIAGFVIALIVTVLTDDAEMGFSTGVGSAATKEIFDAMHPDKHTPSFKDFTVGSVGALFGAAVGKWIITHKQLFGTLLT
jgi:hypothetical protein